MFYAASITTNHFLDLKHGKLINENIPQASPIHRSVKDIRMLSPCSKVSSMRAQLDYTVCHASYGSSLHPMWSERNNHVHGRGLDLRRCVCKRCEVL